MTFRWLPKLQDNNYSPLLGYQFVDKIMNPNDNKLETLSSEFVTYLNTLKEYDDYKYVNDKKLNVDLNTWKDICHVRRMIIEFEFKLETCRKDVADKNILLEHLNYSKKKREIMINELLSNIKELKSQDSHNQDDFKVI